MVTAFVLSVVAMVAMGQVHLTPTTDGWWSVLYLGVVSTTICYLLQTACQQYIDETKAAIILSMESVFGTLFSILLLGEVVTPRMIVGCTIISWRSSSPIWLRPPKTNSPQTRLFPNHPARFRLIARLIHAIHTTIIRK